jgi:hypothetical protein
VQTVADEEAPLDLHLASGLLNSSAADVVLVANDRDGNSRQLYAFKKVLQTKCDYFAARERNPQPTGSDIPGLQPEWIRNGVSSDGATGNSESTKVSDTISTTSKASAGTVIDLDSGASENGKPIVLNMDQLDIDYVTLFNILYYIYLGCFNLWPMDTDLWARERYKLPNDFPPEADPLALYKASKTLLLPDLSRRCLEFLKFTVTPKNVAQRLFLDDNDLRFHDEVIEIYVDYLFAHYDEVKVTDGWKEALKGNDNEDEISKLRWSVMCRITEKLTFATKQGNGANKTNAN